MFFDVKQNNYKLKKTSKYYINYKDKEIAINKFSYKISLSGQASS